MGSKRRKTSPAQEIEHFLDEHERELSLDLYKRLESIAESIDSEVEELTDQIDELETKVEELETELEEANNAK